MYVLSSQSRFTIARPSHRPLNNIPLVLHCTYGKLASQSSDCNAHGVAPCSQCKATLIRRRSPYGPANPHRAQTSTEIQETWCRVRAKQSHHQILLYIDLDLTVDFSPAAGSHKL